MGGRPGLELWGPVGRWIFLNWPRGSWQYDLICGVIILGLFVLPGPQQSTDPPLEMGQVLEAMERADAELRSFTARTVWIHRHALFDEEEVERGTVAYLDPDYFRREVEEPALRTEVIADGLVQVYIPRIKQVQRYRIGVAEESSRLVIPGLSGGGGLQEDYEVTLLGVEAQDADEPGSFAGEAHGVGSRWPERLVRLELIPRAGTEAAKYWRRIELWVPADSWLPARRILLEEHNGDTRTIELLDVEWNASLEPGDFRLRLPPGVEVVEHRPASSS